MIFGWPQSHTTKRHNWNNMDKYEPQQLSRLGTELSIPIATSLWKNECMSSTILLQ